MPRAPGTCPRCGATFDAKPGRIYCSRSCKERARKARAGNAKTEAKLLTVGYIGKPPVVQIGDRHGSLTVIEQAGSAQHGRLYRCACDCGNETTAHGSELKAGARTSCGCKRRLPDLTDEQRHLAGRRMADRNRIRTVHGHARRGRSSPTYNSWLAMWKRCTNGTHRYHHLYGGRGITVCDSWRSFEAFLADMGERPEGKTLDRIDPDGDYEPGNCRWATPTEQRANQRTLDRGGRITV